MAMSIDASSVAHVLQREAQLIEYEENSAEIKSAAPDHEIIRTFHGI